MIIQDTTEQFFYSTKIASTSLVSGFGTKKISKKNYHKTLPRLFTDADKSNVAFFLPDQKHSATIIYLQHHTQRSSLADGVITALSNCCIAVMTADCVPMLFSDQMTGLIGVSHQGWKGTLSRLPQHMVDALVSAGSRPENIKVAIGPAIGQCCYNVQEDVFEQFAQTFPHLQKKFTQLRDDKQYLNLAGLNYLLLLEAGIHSDNIDFSRFCTACDSSRFYSYRRDYNSDASFGEQLSFIVKIQS